MQIQKNTDSINEASKQRWKAVDFIYCHRKFVFVTRRPQRDKIEHNSGPLSRHEKGRVEDGAEKNWKLVDIFWPDLMP